MTSDIIMNWPGKSADERGIEHPAAYHMLDVAAVAERLIGRLNLPDSVRDAFVFLVSLHDVGKMNPGFREMLWGGKIPAVNHWVRSEIVLNRPGRKKMLAGILKTDCYVLEPLVVAAACHHGRPSHDSERSRPDSGVENAEEVIRAFAALWPDASLAALDDDQEADRLSWWLAGLTVAADWIGSNPDWFPATSPEFSLAEYLDRARAQAVKAVDAAGLAGTKPKPDWPLPFRTLRPMQQAVLDAVLPDGCTLAIIEDDTGAGKTEAGLLLAQRMMLADKGAGLYVALPTMATADAMFRRTGADGILAKVLDSPSLVLAHGRAGQSSEFRTLVGQPDTEETDDRVRCSAWLADSRRKALLADIGIGTIDQAMMAVMKGKFSTLRLWGLAGKILIVDEVHEMGDPYMAEAVERLLTFHAGQGGSAILMTATLPIAQRDRLIAAFAKGRRKKVTNTQNRAYPALTIVGADVVVQPVGSKQPDRPGLPVNRLQAEAQAIALLVRSAQAGAACVWVRNTVDAAIAAAQALRAQGVPVVILHARFALCDRKTHEANILDQFGKDRDARPGRILVATQVVESSLDLDFDVMVSDLAPIPALIQRAGRLWRHDRPGRAVDTPCLHVLGPDPEDVRDERWLAEVAERGAWVYPLPDQWRTAQVLAQDGVLVPPSGRRAQIERVLGAEASAVPEVLLQSELNKEGEAKAREMQGRRATIDVHQAYAQGAGGKEDPAVDTRLGLPTRTLVLARLDGAQLVPWAGEDPDGWMLSEVRVSARKLKGLELPDQESGLVADLRADWPKWRQGGDGFDVVLCPVGADGAICEGLRYDANWGVVFQ